MRILSMGEVMVELSGAGPGLWRQAIAGDTYNTAWYLAALRPGWQIDYATRIGVEPMSDLALAAIQEAGIGTGAITRDPTRNIGLYMIALKNGERSFSYWRGQSAARLMAEDIDWLVQSFAPADVIYLSGITLAILSPAGRSHLLAALRGHRVVFDPNIRLRLWEDSNAMTQTISAAAGLSEIVLPSFDDEQAAFGDIDPLATARRYAQTGAAEVLVKNGTGALTLWDRGQEMVLPAAPPVTPVDTTGAGDSFNAGYIAARLAGGGPAEAAIWGQRLAALVVSHPGALVPRDEMAGFRRSLAI